jgi:hypothetical protein
MRRVARNEAVFRAVNEQVETLNRGVGQLTDRHMLIVCECGDLSCIDPLDVPVEDYERVRADSALFLVKPGHELPDTEDVVGAEEGFLIVRKHAGEGERVSRETSLRS